MDTDNKSPESPKKKLVIRRVTVSALRIQAGLRTGGTCDNACMSTSDTTPLTPGCPAGKHVKV